MNSLGYNSSYLLCETGLHAEVGCPETLRHKQREDGGAVKSAPLIPLMFELNSNWGGAHLTEQSPSYITHLSSSPWAGEHVLYSPVSCSQLSKDQLQFGLNNLNDFWWIAHMGSWESGGRCILENEIGEWVFCVYWYWSDTHTLDLCRWMSSQHVGIKAVSCGAVGVVLLFVDFALHVDSYGDLICFCSPCCFLDRFMMVNTSRDGCFSVFLDCERWQYESMYRKQMDQLEQKNMW